MSSCSVDEEWLCCPIVRKQVVATKLLRPDSPNSARWSQAHVASQSAPVDALPLLDDVLLCLGYRSGTYRPPVLVCSLLFGPQVDTTRGVHACAAAAYRKCMLVRLGEDDLTTQGRAIACVCITNGSFFLFLLHKMSSPFFAFAIQAVPYIWGDI